MPNLIPEPHAGYVRRICELVESDSVSLRDRISRKAKLSDSYATRLVEDPAIICVAGERGSGKTTVLATASAQLAAQGHVVIPPIRPEYFAGPTSLLPTTVAHLQTTVRADWATERPPVDRQASIEIRTAIDRTLRQANLVSYGMPEASSLRADEQAADRSLAASADSDFLDNWQRLTTQVREMAATRRRAAPHPLIVIPVDDPDLAPGTLRQILLDLRLMTSVDGVVGIACLDLEEARSVLSDAYARTYEAPPSQMLSARVVEAQIAKAFPDDRKVEIRGLDAEEKLAFTALDLPLPSLERLCRAHRIGRRYGTDTLASVMRLPSGRPSFYTEALPSNPRDLRGLAYRLSSVKADPASVGAAAMELCRTAIQTGLKQSGVTDPEMWPSGPPFEVLAPVDGLPACALSFEDIRFSTLVRAQRMVPSNRDDGGVAVAVSHETGIEARFVVRGRDVPRSRRLHPSLAYALLLLREFEHYYGVIHCSVSGIAPIGGGEDRRSAYLSVRFDNVEADQRFLNAPAWEAHYDYFVLDEAIGGLMPIASAPHDLSDRRLAVEAYMIDFCRHVVAVQSRRRPAREVARASRGVRDRDESKARRLIDRELARLFRDIGACLELGASRERRDVVRVADFRSWVEVGLPNICHHRLVRPEFVDQLLGHRAKLLGHRLPIANANLCDVLEGRIKAKLDEAWVVPLIELLKRFDDSLANVLMAQHLAAIEAIERNRHRLLGESVVTPRGEPEHDGEPAPQPPSSDFDIALAVLDELEHDAQARMRRSEA